MKRVLLEREDWSPAFDFYYYYLKLPRRLHIEFHVDDTLHLSGTTGVCSHWPGIDEYEVKISPFQLPNMAHPLEILAHELVHVKQYVRGELVDDPDRDLCWWKGKVYPDPYNYDSDTVYRNVPWEVQAFALQRKLYQEYLRSLE